MGDLLFDWWSTRRGVAIVTPKADVSWIELRDRIERLAAVLDVRVGAGGSVGIAGGNVPETLVAYLACFVTGRTPVAINPRLARDEFAYLLGDAQVELLLGGTDVACTVEGLDSVLGFTGLYWDAEVVSAESSWSTVLDAAQPGAVDLQRPPAIPLLYTSGTSGRPKGTRVRWVTDPGGTVAEYLERLVASIEHLPRGPHQVAGPLYHNGPLLAVRAVLSGRTVVLPPRFGPETFLRLVAENRSASSVLVPTHLTRLLSLDAGVREGYDMSSLDKVLLTGAACPHEVKRAVIDWWGPVLEEAYGGTESGTVCRIGAAEWLEHRGSVGRTVPDFDVVVVDPGGRPVEPGVTGRLYFRDLSGRGIEYHNAPEKTRDAHLEPGTFTLGDVGHVDRDGYVYITDRDVDMVVSGGVNIYPAEVERVLRDHPAVSDVAVLGVPSPDMGEELRALVVMDPGSAVTDTDLAAFCRTRLAGYKCPRRFEFVDKLPRNEMGKLNKRRLRQTYWPETQPIGD